MTLPEAARIPCLHTYWLREANAERIICGACGVTLDITPERSTERRLRDETRRLATPYRFTKGDSK